MTAEEAVQVVQYLGAAWRTELPAATVAIWADHLRGVSLEVGMESAQLAVQGGGSWMPTAGEFLATCRQVARRRADQGRPALPESTTPPTRREVALAHIAELRAVVASARPPIVKPTPDPDRPRSTAPPEFCPNDDHSRCGADGPPQPRKDPAPS